jgi:hypothetical protein
VKYKPAIGDRLRDRYGRPGEIINTSGPKYLVEWQHAVGTITKDHSRGEVKKARKRYRKLVEGR